jgi:hypothetical protein
MHATTREKYEASVMMSDPIEIHLTYLRAGLDEVKAALPLLRDKIDGLSNTLDAKIGKTNDRIDATNARLEAMGSALSDKIDRVNSTLSDKIDAVNSDLSSKISILTNGLADVRGIQKAMFWVLGSAGTLTAFASLAQAARTFNWI